MKIDEKTTSITSAKTSVPQTRFVSMRSSLSVAVCVERRPADDAGRACLADPFVAGDGFDGRHRMPGGGQARSEQLQFLAGVRRRRRQTASSR